MIDGNLAMNSQFENISEKDMQDMEAAYNKEPGDPHTEWIEANIPPEKEGHYNIITEANCFLISAYELGDWGYNRETDEMRSIAGMGTPDRVARYRPSTYQPFEEPTPSTLSPEIGEGPPAISEDYMKWLESKKPTYYKGEWLFSDWAYGAKTAYVHFQKEISRLKEEAHAYRSALQEIEDPTKFIQSRSDKEGKPIDGQRAFALSFDPVYLRGVATLALKKYPKQ